MGIELSYKYLINVISPTVGESDAIETLDEVLHNLKLPKKTNYEVDEFIKICEELRNKDKRVKSVCALTISQVRLSESSKVLRDLSF